MKLDPDCVRSILFSVEKNATMNHFVSATDFEKDNIFNKFDPNKVAYHVRYAEQANLIYDVDWYMSGYDIKDLTPSGHDFLNDIRTEENWHKTKEVAQKVGTFSLDALKSIASGVTTAAINRYLGQ